MDLTLNNLQWLMHHKNQTKLKIVFDKFVCFKKKKIRKQLLKKCKYKENNECNSLTSW